MHPISVPPGTCWGFDMPDPLLNTVERYLEAAGRENTRRSYATAVRHFEIDWGGHLPATADSVARYLATYAGKLSVNTLKSRLAGLARWHIDFGFVDPTRAPLVRRTLKGIQSIHAVEEKQAEPLQLSELSRVLSGLEEAGAVAREGTNHAKALCHLRDRALIALGFWRGFRGDELTRLQVEHVRVVPGQGMTLFLPRTKGDRQNEGTTYKVPLLSRCCPVVATQDWIRAAALERGPQFRKVDRWSNISDAGLHPNSIIRVLRNAFALADLESPEAYSGHSLRRGFATWADANGWSVKALMEYVGWKDANSAMRYLEGTDAFAQKRIEAAFATGADAPLALADTAEER
jgi:integrase